jgi:transcriptional regulator with XRE-family HTH domain
MIEFGKTLRLAREAKGYTISQLAEATRMIHQTIEDLENENFNRIAAPIYGRGFVKLYCEAVGLDPKPMVAEFMEIFNGNRELGIKERIPAPAQSPAPPSAPAPAPEAPAVRQMETPAEPAMPAPPPVPAEKTENRLSRYAAPIREASLPSIPPSVWRIAALAIGALLVLGLMGMGLKALYKATSGAEALPPPEQVETSVAEEDAGTVKTAVAGATLSEGGRNKVDVPPLYVD